MLYHSGPVAYPVPADGGGLAAHHQLLEVLAVGLVVERRLQVPVHLHRQPQAAAAKVHDAPLQRGAGALQQQGGHLREVALDAALGERVDAVANVVLHARGLGRVQVPGGEGGAGRS